MFIQTFPLCTLKVHSMKNIVDRFSIDYYTTSFFECLSNGSVRERKATFLIKKDFFSKSFIGPFSLRKNIRDITARVVLIANPYFLSRLEQRCAGGIVAPFSVFSPRPLFFNPRNRPNAYAIV